MVLSNVDRSDFAAISEKALSNVSNRKFNYALVPGSLLSRHQARRGADLIAASGRSCPPPIAYLNRSRHDLNDPASNWLIEKRALRLQEVSNLHQQLMH